MKVAASIIMVLALVMAIVPAFTDCQSQGRSLQLANGNTVPMKCHWTAIAELSLGILTFLFGGMLFFRKSRDSHSSLSLMGIALGALTILIPTTLIGVCANPSMLCNMIMKPTLIFTGTLLTTISLGTFVFSMRNPQSINNPQPAV